jgi:hypothetical protein
MPAILFHPFIKEEGSAKRPDGIIVSQRENNTVLPCQLIDIKDLNHVCHFKYDGWWRLLCAEQAGYQAIVLLLK